jgi:hypothetical protein
MPEKPTLLPAHLCDAPARAIKDILMVGEIVGHETQQIETQTYTHPIVADRYAAICKLDYVAERLEIGHLFPRPAT